MTALSLEPPIYNVSGILYSPTSGVIELNEERSQLRAREANLFKALIESFPEVLSRTEIENTLWKDSYATNATINQTVKALRFSLKDDQRTLIRTIPKQGYVLSTKPALFESIIEDDDTSAFDHETAELIEPESSVSESLFSVKQWSLLIAFSLSIFFAIGSGLGSKTHERLSHQHGENWVLFAHDKEEDEPIPFLKMPTQQFALKESEGYRICTIINEELKCFLR